MLDSDIIDVFEGNVTRGEAAKDKTDKKWYVRSANQLYTLMSHSLLHALRHFAFYEYIEGNDIEVLHETLIMHIKNVHPSSLSWWD
ncbi:hypothetical protein JCM1840_004958 [Sporobolomyces johnsonii]